MPGQIRVSLGPDGRLDLSAVIDRLKRSQEKILKRVGVLLLASSQLAFKQQRFGTFAWPARYPNQPRPKLNIAGMVSDLANGPILKKRRLDDRPAAMDTGALRNSLAMKVRGKRAVQVGSTLPYAGRIHAGGKSFQAITQTVRKNLGKLYHGSSKKQRKLISQRAGFLFQVDMLETTVNARPFVGITDDARRKILKAIEQELSNVNQ